MSETASNVVPGPRPVTRRGEAAPTRGRMALAPASCVNETPLSRISPLAESLRDVRWLDITLAPADEELLPAAIAEARAALEPGAPWDVLAALQMIAERRNLCLPTGLGLDMDVEIMAEWPADLFRKAVRGVWEHFKYARFPEVPDFREHIAKDLAERRKRLANLELLAKKLATQRSKAGAATVRIIEPAQEGPRHGPGHAGCAARRVVAAIRP
jgi:hypothetical protein